MKGSAGHHGYLSEIESINPGLVKRLADRSRPIPQRGDAAPASDRGIALTLRYARPSAHRDGWPGEEWRLVGWRKGEGEPAKHPLSTLPAEISRDMSWCAWPSIAKSLDHQPMLVIAWS
jgi:hypothetical protein